MGLKTKIGMAMATSAAGAAMVVGGSFALFSNYQYTNSDTFTAGTLAVNADQTWTKVNAGSQNFSNMAPGDTAEDSFTIRNSGSLAEWVSLETTVKGAQQSIWSDFSTSMDNSAGANGAYHGLSDQSAAGQGGGGIYNTAAGGDFTTDNHHATYGYTVVVHHTGSADATPVSVPNLSGNQWNYAHPFLLQAGDTATVTYSVNLPLAAHNDYQGLSGSLNVEVDAVQARNNWRTQTDSSRHDGDPGTGAMPYSWQPDTGL